MGKQRTANRQDEADATANLRRFLGHMHQAVTEKDRREHPPCIEWEQAHDECRELVRQHRASGSSDGHILHELRAWAEHRPLPVLAAFQRAAGMAIDRTPVVADCLR